MDESTVYFKRKIDQMQSDVRAIGLNLKDQLLEVNTSYNEKSMEFQSMRLPDIKSFTHTYKYVIPFTNPYEPFAINVYSLDGLFVKSIYFDKTGLVMLYADELKGNSQLLYSDSVVKQ